MGASNLGMGTRVLGLALMDLGLKIKDLCMVFKVWGSTSMDLGTDVEDQAQRPSTSTGILGPTLMDSGVATGVSSIVWMDLSRGARSKH